MAYRVLWNSGHKIPYPIYDNKTSPSIVRSFPFLFLHFYFKSVYVVYSSELLEGIYCFVSKKDFHFWIYNNIVCGCVRMSQYMRMCMCSRCMFVYREGWKIAGNMKLFFFLFLWFSYCLMFEFSYVFIIFFCWCVYVRKEFHYFLFVYDAER